MTHGIDSMTRPQDEGFDEITGGLAPRLGVVLPADEIPLGSQVTKRTGRAQYTLGDRLRVFNAGGEKQEIVAQEGTRFLIGDRGDANAIPASTELIWLIEEEELLFWLEARQNGTPQ